MPAGAGRAVCMPKRAVHADERRAGERGRKPDGRLGEARDRARDAREPVHEDRLVGNELVVEARPEPVPGDARPARCRPRAPRRRR